MQPDVSTLGKVYNDKPEYKEEVVPERGILSSKIFKYALVPKTPGEYELGVIEIPVFNPKLGQYAFLRSELGKLIVEPGVAEEKPVVVGASPAPAGASKEDVKVLGQDLLGPHRNLNLMVSHELTVFDWVLLGGIGGVPLAAAFSSFAAGLVRHRRVSNPNLQRRAKARKFCLDALHRASLQCSEGNSELGISAADRAFREFLGDKLGQTGAAFTPRDVDAQLTLLGLSTEARQKVSELQAKFEKVAFGGRAPVPDEAQQWIKDLQLLVEEIDRKC